MLQDNIFFPGHLSHKASGVSKGKCAALMVSPYGKN
jgi:hypothetical protein